MRFDKVCRPMSEKDYFLKARKEFAEEHDSVQRILLAIDSRKAEPRRVWAIILFVRIEMIGRSLLTLCNPELRHQKESSSEVSLLGHCSIAALGRSLLEAWLFFVYMTETAISEEEWLLREAVMELHQTISKHKLRKHIGDEKDQELSNKMDNLKKTIRSNPMFQSLEVKSGDDRISGDDLLSGKYQFINGRNAIIRKAGWNVENFSAMFNVLSNYAHSSPFSFTRNMLDPDEPASGFVVDDQFRISGVTLEYLTPPLSFACQRMFHLYPETFLKGETKH